MSNWNRIKEHGGVIAIVAALVVLIGMQGADTNMLLNEMHEVHSGMDSIHKDIRDMMVRLERHDVHIDYLMTGRVQIQAPKVEP